MKDPHTAENTPAASRRHTVALQYPRAAGALAALVLAAAPAAWAAPVPVESRFDTDAEGWTLRNLFPPPDAAQDAAHVPAEGRIAATDIYPWTVFSAPAVFLGDLGGHAGGSVAFELSVDASDPDAARFPTLLLRSGADYLAWFGGVPGSALTPFVATLAPSAQWLFGQTPEVFAPATAGDFSRVLGAVDALFINADWATARVDIAGLDNVVLAAAAAAVPEPASAALLVAAALGALGVSARSRRQSRA